MPCMSVKFGPSGNQSKQLECIAVQAAEEHIWTWVTEGLKRPDKTEVFRNVRCLRLLQSKET